MWVDCSVSVALAPLESGSKADSFGLLKPPGGLEVGNIRIFTNKGIKGLGGLLGKINKYVTALEPNW